MDFQQYTVWQRSRELTKAIYRATRAFPDEERFGLSAQIRRSVISIGSNIAEGAGRGSDRDFARFVSIARGSTVELHHQLIVATDLGYISVTKSNELIGKTTEVRRMCTSLRQRLLSSPVDS